MANPGLYRNPSAFPLGPEPNMPTVTSSPGSGVTMVTPPTHTPTYYLAGSAPSAPFFSPAPQAMFQAPSAPPFSPVEAQQSSLVHHAYHPSPATPLNWHPPTPTVYPVAQGGNFSVVSPPVLVSQAHPPLTHTVTGDPTNTSQNNNGNNPSRRNARRNRTKRRASRRGRRRNTRRN